MRVGITRFTCDRCRKSVEQASDRVGAPVYWLGLLVNSQSADSSIDHHGWDRWHWCPECKHKFMRFVRNVDGDSVEPEVAASLAPGPSCGADATPHRVSPVPPGVVVSADQHTNTPPGSAQ